MNLSAISRESVLGKLLRAPLSLIPAGTKVPILQGRLRGMRWIVGSATHGCWLGSYEYNKQRIFENHVRAGNTVFDIGAHVGFYTLLAARLVGPRGHVYAFEPLPRNLRYLREHLRINALDNVTVMEAAVSGESGTACFAEGPGTFQGRVLPVGNLRVRSVTLDELVFEEKVPAPQCVKMDIEGAEFMALRGAHKVLSEFRPTIFLATHGQGIHRDCCNYLRSCGYQVLPIDGVQLADSCEILATPATGANA